MARGGRPPTDPHLVEAALRLVDGGKTPAEASELLGVGQSTIYQWLADRRRAQGSGNGPQTPAPSPPARKVPPRPKTAPGRPETPAAPPGGMVANPPPDDDGDEEESDLAGIHAAPDDITAIDKLIGLVERKLARASEARAGALAATLAGLIVKRAKLRPPPAPTPEELERQARPLADEVLEGIEAAVRAAEVELGLP